MSATASAARPSCTPTDSYPTTRSGAPEQARAAIDCCAILLCSDPSLLVICACHEHFIKRSDYSARILDVREQGCLCFASRLWSLSCSRDSNWMGNHFGPSSTSRARARRQESSDWATWYRKTYGAEPDYSAILAGLAASPAERRSILHSYIEPDEDDRAEGKKLPTAAHHAIAGLVRDGYVRVILTTNFDRLLENALREVGVEPTVVTSVDSLSGAEPLTHSPCYVLKLHGDYKDARILNTDEELGVYPPQYDALLDRILDEHGLIVCGWSGEWDDALRAALLRAPNRRYPTFCSIRGKVGSGAEPIISQRKAVTIPVADADSFFLKLAELVKTLAETRKQSPLTIDILVGSIKRYVARPEFRIRLDEVITQEVNKLFDCLDAKELSPQGVWSVEEFRRRLKLYEATTEPLAKAFGVLGRWG